MSKLQVPSQLSHFTQNESQLDSERSKFSNSLLTQRVASLYENIMIVDLKKDLEKAKQRLVDGYDEQYDSYMLVDVLKEENKYLNLKVKKYQILIRDTRSKTVNLFKSKKRSQVKRSLSGNSSNDNSLMNT